MDGKKVITREKSLPSPQNSVKQQKGAAGAAAPGCSWMDYRIARSLCLSNM